MPRLFIKIFLWFWLAMTCIGAILVAVALTTNPLQSYLERQKNRLTRYGNELLVTYQNYGTPQLTKKIIEIKEKEFIKLALVNSRTRHIGRQPEQPYLQEFALRALTDFMLSPLPKQIRPKIANSNHFFATIPLENNYLLLAEIPKPTKLELLLDPHALTLRFGAIFIIAGIVCYLLARSISSPIMKLRKAAQAFSTGHLDTRVSPDFGQQRGELADLANDFDTMAERIESLLATQQRLLRDISHELRSPLARLGVALELARRNSSGNSAPLDKIETEAERLNNLIGQLLTITQLESLTELTAKESIELPHLLAQIVEDANFESQTLNRKVTIGIHTEATIDGSPELLGRAFENVIRNGLHHTEEGSSVDVQLNTINNETIEVTVRDHGPGVPPHCLQDLFRPFFRVSESRTRKSGGSGVGLAIADRAIRLHAGSISAANHPDGGMLFTIRLPTKRANTFANSSG